MKRTWIKETTNCIGEIIRLNGWAERIRRMGDKLVFIDLRDRSGLVQVVCFKSELDEAGVGAVDELGVEYVLEIEGQVQKRGEKQINSNLPTGTVEVSAKRITILNRCQTPPFEIVQDTRSVNEELRLKYRYLDLRSERMAKNLFLRDRVETFFRDFLHDHDFLEIETPLLTKGTPEGAREFLVPSRVHPGKFYVLPQSPQQFKQLLMVGGVERYFQIARCFRDEDQRGDRQSEFTQLDLEMSFVEKEDVINLVETMMIKLVEVVAPEKRLQQVPFPRFTYKQVMKEYGTDKPDLRADKNDANLLAFCWVTDFPFFEKTDEGGWTFTHNPFSAPLPEHRGWLMKKERISEIITTQYDIVLNGYEIGGGSIRNHEPEALRRVLEIIGLSDDQINNQFGHMLEAFSYGAPPHGGIAPGIDRIVMILANEPNIREVIPIPKTGDARDLLMGAPSELPESALRDAHVKII